jgi:Conserved TM helix
MTDVQLNLVEPAKTVIAQISQFVINILLVLAILLIGWLLAKVIKFLSTKLLKSIKVDDLSERIELDNLLAKGGIPYTLSELIGLVFYWLSLLITFVTAINAIGLTIANDLLNRLILYIPNVIAGVFILILGMFVATMLKNIVQTAATNAGLAQAKLLARFVEVIVVIFAALVTFEQLGIAPRLIELIIGIVLASFGLAFALAFGFGCQDLAKKAMGDLLDKLRTKK